VTPQPETFEYLPPDAVAAARADAMQWALPASVSAERHRDDSTSDIFDPVTACVGLRPVVWVPD
jgi:hypothetical protein